MQVIYSIKLRFITVEPLYAECTMYVDSLGQVAAVKAAAAKEKYEVLGYSMQHIMTPQEIVKDVGRERAECRRAAGLED